MTVTEVLDINDKLINYNYVINYDSKSSYIRN